MTRRQRRRRQPYAWLQRIVGTTAVFRVKSRTSKDHYLVTVTRSFRGEPIAHCPCIAGQHSAGNEPRCFHARRALASYLERLDPVAKKGRAPVAA